MAQQKTYETLVIHQVFLAPPEWRAVFWDQDTQTHIVCPVPLLALCSRRTYPCWPKPQTLVPTGVPEDELREVVGMTFDDTGFDIADNCANFCCLVAPEENAERPCGCFGHEVPVEKTRRRTG